jgi:hypothetical protein
MVTKEMMFCGVLLRYVLPDYLNIRIKKLSKMMQTSVRIAGIRTDYLQNVTQGRCRYTNLFGGWFQDFSFTTYASASF